MHGCGCCSMQCERRSTCALSDINIHGQAILVVEDFYDYGIGGFSSTESEVLWWCGSHGNWGMYVPLEEVTE